MGQLREKGGRGVGAEALTPARLTLSALPCLPRDPPPQGPRDRAQRG